MKALGNLAAVGDEPGIDRVPEDCIELPAREGRAAERAAAFPSSDWTVLAEESTRIHAVPMRTPDDHELIPGYLAVLAARAVPAGVERDPA